MTVVDLRSDNVAAVAPAIMDAVVAANRGTDTPYGADTLTEQLEALVREVFDNGNARVFPVTSGTAANALAISAMTPPWGAVWCHPLAHIVTNEAAAASALSGGASMQPVAGANGLIEPDALTAQLRNVRWGDPHESQPAVLSITQPSDVGTRYPLERLGELSEIAHANTMLVHLDGARLANAVASLGCSPADATWRAGVDTFSLGATKNGAMSAEAIVTFDDGIAQQLVFRTKRSGHTSSKMRFQSAQLIAYLTDDYWLQLADTANARMRDLVDGIAAIGTDRFELRYRAEVNMAFYGTDDATAQRLEAAGVRCYRILDTVRLVTSWATSQHDVSAALAAFDSVHRR